MAEEKVEVSKEASVGDEDLGASAEAHAEAGVEVTDTSVSAEAEVGASVEAHAGTTQVELIWKQKQLLKWRHTQEEVQKLQIPMLRRRRQLEQVQR